MSGKPTPGPWVAETDPGHYDTLSNVVAGATDSSKQPNRQMSVSVGGFAGWREQEANTRLIAAAGTAAHQLYEAGYDGVKTLREMPDLVKEAQLLSLFAMTTGGVAGRDKELAQSVGRMVAILARLNKKETPDDAA